LQIENNRKYAKWKAAYIHNCLKNGETPISGPLPEDEDEASAAAGGSGDTGPVLSNFLHLLYGTEPFLSYFTSGMG